jgi:hypothetical protein
VALARAGFPTAAAPGSHPPTPTLIPRRRGDVPQACAAARAAWAQAAAGTLCSLTAMGVNGVVRRLGDMGRRCATRSAGAAAKR